MSYSENVRKEILKKGLDIYKDDPAKLNHHFVAKELDISNAKIHYHFGKDLKQAVLKYAVEQGDSRVIVQLIASKDALVQHLTKEDRQRHVDEVYA
jgi:hypothetical protein